MFLYDFATKTAQKPDTVATYIRRNEKIFKNHVERREKQLWLDEKAVKILLKKYPEVQRKKYPWWKNETEFEEAMVNAIKGLWDNQEILRKELDGILIAIEELQDAIDYRSQQYTNGESRECLKGLLAYVIMTVAKKRYDVSCRHKRTPSSSHYWGFFSFWTVELPLG